jgi:putative addiction module CopG family antidote
MAMTLSPQIAEEIRELLDTGKYSDANEVLAEAIRLLKDRDDREEILALIQAGLDDFERGDYFEWGLDSMAEISREADEEDRLGLPIPEDDSSSLEKRTYRLRSPRWR